MSSEQREKLFWLGFSAFPGIGPYRFKLLRDYFGSAETAWKADKKTLLDVGLGKKLVEQFVDFQREFSPEGYREDLEKKNITAVTQDEKSYPELLREIPDPPIALYIRGDINRLSTMEHCIAVVGTRKMSFYGAEVTKNITRGLVESGCTIVSGLAYGVDTVAHKTAVENTGATIAVLGCGVDIIHPSSNATLYWKIIREAGVVVSEYPPGKFAEKGLFPARNRIISGLSLGVVVTEGAQDSGALITARYALEQGRDVFAVPGPITSRLSSGPTSLLKQGATLVSEADDVIEELTLLKKNKRSRAVDGKRRDLSQSEKTIVDFLLAENLSFDAIVAKTGMLPQSVASTLTLMEVKQVVRLQDGGLYGLIL